ncbi:MAG: LysM peptidoglycan-binding domain-containing protein [Muricoprocola sp.]
MPEIKSEWKLPKNIRQIGDGGGERKIYIEDYVMTYLQQLGDENSQGMALLLGTVKEKNLFPYIFIDSALEVSHFHQSEEEKEEVRRKISKYFGSKNIVGWFISAKESPFTLNQELLDIYREEFAGENQVLIAYDKVEEESYVFMMEEEAPVEQPGYYIYFEKNVPMQNYMVENNKGKAVENESAEKDSAIHLFRKLIKEKQGAEEPVKMGKLGYAVSGFLVMTILALGVTMIYNYDKMRDVENNLAKLTGNVESQREYVTDEVQPAMVNIEETAEDKDQTEEEQQERVKETTQQEAVTESYITEEETEKISESETEQEEAQQTAASPIRTSYIVKVGDTLAGISEMYYGTLEKVEDICSLNGITDENTILPGQKILLP